MTANDHACADLFQQFPPHAGFDDEEMLEIMGREEDEDVEQARRDLLRRFSGRVIYAISAQALEEGVVDEHFDGKMPFFFGYETKQGWLYDQHLEAYRMALAHVLPDLASRLEFSISEAQHCIALEPGQSAAQCWAGLAQRFRQAGALPMEKEKARVAGFAHEDAAFPGAAAPPSPRR